MPLKFFSSRPQIPIVPESFAFSLAPLVDKYRPSAREVSRDELEAALLFQEVELSYVWGLLDRCLCLELDAGQLLIDREDGVRCLYVLLEGTCTVHLNAPDSEAVATITRGESVGELSLIDNSPPSAFVIAETTCRVLAVGPEAFWGLINTSHEFTVNLLSLLSRRLRGNNAAVSESRRLQEEYKRHALVDGLTGLFNRRRLDEVLPRYVARSHFEGKTLSVLMIDVDHFKSINDRFGHYSGDRVLYEVAHVLRDRCRPTDFVARYGGEEFTVVLPGARAVDAELVAERLRLAVEGLSIQLESGLTLPPMTASIGIAELIPDESTGDVLTRADGALYRAKRTGRNRACVAGPPESQVLETALG